MSEYELCCDEVPDVDHDNDIYSAVCLHCGRGVASQTIEELPLMWNAAIEAVRKAVK